MSGKCVAENLDHKTFSEKAAMPVHLAEVK